MRAKQAGLARGHMHTWQDSKVSLVYFTVGLACAAARDDGNSLDPKMARRQMSDANFFSGTACPSNTNPTGYAMYGHKYCHSENGGGVHCGGGCTVEEHVAPSGSPSTCQYIYRGLTPTGCVTVFGKRVCCCQYKDCDGPG